MRRPAEERRHTLLSADLLLGAAMSTLFAHAERDDPEPMRPKTEDEVTMMQVMIAQAQATIAGTNLLYLLAEERIR